MAKERNVLNAYLLPVLSKAWIGDLDLPDLNDCIQNLTLKNGRPASGNTKSTAAAVLRRLFTWAREERIIPVNPALELRTGWGASLRRRVVIPSIPQVLRLAAALDHFKPRLGDLAIVMAFVGLRWEELVAVPADHVDLDIQCMKIDRTGGYLGYAMWRRYLVLARGFTSAHPDGVVGYTAHELRHVCASLLIASGASDLQVAGQMGHSKIETTKNIYGHLFAQDRQFILEAINAAVSRLSILEETEDREGRPQAA